MSAYEGPAIVNPNLVLYLDAANPKSYPGSGTAWTDLSGNGNSGTLVNSPTYSSNNNGYIGFTGPSGGKTCLVSPTLGLSELQVPLTICAWFYQTNQSSLATVFGQYSVTSSGRLVKLLRADGSALVYYCSSSDGNYQAINYVSSAIPGNTWVFGAVTVAGSIASPTVTLSMNATNFETTNASAFTSTPDTTVQVQIGNNQQSTNGGSQEGFDGYISSVMVYNQALTQDEIRQNFHATRGRYGI